jgi:sphingosine kinase
MGIHQFHCILRASVVISFSLCSTSPIPLRSLCCLLFNSALPSLSSLILFFYPSAMPKLIAIMNPRSGTGRAPKILEDIRPVFASAGIKLDTRATTHAGHAAEIAQSAELTDIDGICVIGGDGTMHEALNGMMNRADGGRVPLGLIPGGCGNSLMHDLNLTDPVRAAERIVQLKPRPLDLMNIRMPESTCYSFNLAAFGIMVTANMKAERLRMFGHRRYDIAGVWDIMFHRHHEAVLTIDDESPAKDDYAFIIGMNTMYMGVGMKIAPSARLDDGKVDLLLVRHAKRHQLIRMLTRVYKGNHVGDPALEYHKVTSFSIETPTPQPLNIDGEMKGSTPVRITTEPHAAELL